MEHNRIQEYCILVETIEENLLKFVDSVGESPKHIYLGRNEMKTLLLGCSALADPVVDKNEKIHNIPIIRVREDVHLGLGL